MASVHKIDLFEAAKIRRTDGIEEILKKVNG